MTLSLSALNLRGILLDIEGTTTPISFVYDVLFPFARARVKNYLAKHWESSEVGRDSARLREEHAGDLARNLSPPKLEPEPREAAIDSMATYVAWLIDHDRKSTGLKSLQGRVWQEGYRDGTLRSQVFADVPPALECWKRAGLQVSIFSSGSVLAQQLLFAHSDLGNLTKSIDRYFDTTTGAKTAAQSYRRIANEMQLVCAEILFISDVVAELDAAAGAEMQTLLCIRPGNHPQLAGHAHKQIWSFDEIGE